MGRSIAAAISSTWAPSLYGMEVAGRDRDRGDGGRADGVLQARGIPPAAREHLELIGDPALVPEVPQPSNDLRGGNHEIVL